MVDGLLVDVVAFGQRPQALFTMLYCSTDDLCRSDATMQSLAHNASFHSLVEEAPSKPGINTCYGELQIYIILK